MTRQALSHNAGTFAFSDVYSEMTRLASATNSINLSQGYPNFEPPAELTAGAQSGLLRSSQYSASEGTPQLRSEVALFYCQRGLWDPDTEITITAGCTEALLASLLATVTAGDEVLYFEPFYDYYPGLVHLAGGKSRTVALQLTNGQFSLNRNSLTQALTEKTKVLLLNLPHNPTGMLLPEDDLRFIATLADEHDLLVISDEVYDQLWYECHPLPSMISELRHRLIVCAAASKLLGITGWRVGWTLAPPEITRAIRFVHRHLSFCAPTPLQTAVAAALNWANTGGYWAEFRSSYQERSEILCTSLMEAGLKPSRPAGAFFVMADYSHLAPDLPSHEFAIKLAQRTGVTCLPLETYFSTPENAQPWVRFAFCKDTATLIEAGRRLRRLAEGEWE